MSIKVQMNDTNIKMLFQEKITKELLEYNYRREGPILELMRNICGHMHLKSRIKLMVV